MKNQKQWIYLVVGVVLVAVLGAGAFTAMQLMAAQNEPADLPPGSMVLEDVFDDGSGNPISVRTIILPAEELPDRPAEAAGVLVEQVDNSYMVGTGSIEVSIEIVNGETSRAVDHSGPKLEVVTDRNTQFYRDVTEFEPEFTESKEVRLEQDIIPVERPETLPEGTEMQAWGQRSGDRIIAEVVVFSESR